MSLHLPHRHELSIPPPQRVEYAVRNNDGELLDWRCGCLHTFGTYESAEKWSHEGSVVKRTVTETPWTLA